MGTIGANVEIPQFTEALYDARELAMSRMQARGRGARRRRHRRRATARPAAPWGGHTTEFFAIGTAVRPIRDDHTIATPTLTLPLTD